VTGQARRGRGWNIFPHGWLVYPHG
jgi:hypothetical protein